MKLEIIEDPTRLKEGDLIVVPSEKDKTRKRLHLSVSTIGGHGVSYGFTGRSDNKAETITRLLVDDPGTPRVFFVHDVRQKHYWDDNTLKYGDLLGGSRKLVKSEVPTISWAEFALLPGICPADDEDASCLAWKGIFAGEVAEALIGLVPAKAFVSGTPRSEDKPTDAYTRLVFDTWLTRDESRDYRHMNLGENIPECNRRSSILCAPPDTPVTRDDLDEFVSNRIFTFGCHYGSKDCTIVARTRFFEWYKKSGATFLRPDKEWNAMMARHVAAHLVASYADNCTRVMRAIKSFLAGLKTDTDLMVERGKGSCEVAKKLALRRKERDKLFKGLV